MRGFSESVRTIVNPLPKTTWQQVAEKVSELTGTDVLVEDIPQARRPGGVFDFIWTYSGGSEAEQLILNAGDTFGLRETEVKVFLSDGLARELGMVVVDNYQNKEELRAASIRGLEEAVKFYRVRGKEGLIKSKSRMELTDDQVKAQLHFFLPYFINEAKYQIIKARLDDLRGVRRVQQQKEAAQAAR